eukprot:scaffold239297_cov33-Tisochrysis_lutea.AAC.2
MSISPFAIGVFTKSPHPWIFERFTLKRARAVSFRFFSISKFPGGSKSRERMSTSSSAVARERLPRRARCSAWRAASSADSAVATTARLQLTGSDRAQPLGLTCLTRSSAPCCRSSSDPCKTRCTGSVTQPKK